MASSFARNYLVLRCLRIFSLLEIVDPTSGQLDAAAL
jgi:hypothetical protein